MVLLLVLGFTKDPLAATIGLTVAAGSAVLAESGFEVNKLDVGPRYAAIIAGISNGIAQFAGKPGERGVGLTKALLIVQVYSVSPSQLTSPRTVAPLRSVGASGDWCSS